MYIKHTYIQTENDNIEWQTGSTDGHKKHIKRNKYQWPQKQQQL